MTTVVFMLRLIYLLFFFCGKFPISDVGLALNDEGMNCTNTSDQHDLTALVRVGNEKHQRAFFLLLIIRIIIISIIIIVIIIVVVVVIILII